MKVVQYAQRSPEWLSWKKQGIGASEAGTIAAAAGLIDKPAAWMDTPHELWQGKLGLAKPKDFSFAMQRGVNFEDEAISAYTKESGHIVSPVCAEMDGRPHVHASFDGISFDMNVIVEAKIPAKAVLELAAANKVVPYYIPQCVQQCLVAWGHPDEWAQGCEHHFYAYSPEAQQGHLVAVRADAYKTMAAKLLPELDWFWQCVENLTPPYLDEWIQAAIAYRMSKIDLDLAKEAETKAKEALIACMPKGRKKYSGAGVQVTISEKAGSVQYAELVKSLNLPQDKIEKFRGETSSSARVTVSEKTALPTFAQITKFVAEPAKAPRAWDF